MNVTSESNNYSPDINDISTNFLWIGRVGFWGKLALAFIAFLCLLFAWSGRNFSQETNTGIGVSIFFAVCGLVVLAISIYFAFRYTRLAKGLRTGNPNLTISKSDSISLLQIELILSLVGILLHLFGAGTSMGVQIAKAVSQPPGVAIADPDNIIRALDVFVAVANVDGIAAHFLGVVASLYLLYKVYQY